MRIDDEAVREFVTRDYPHVVATVALICGTREAAEEIVQEAVLRAWTRDRRGKELASLTAWVMTVSLNLARSRLRRIRSELRAHERVADGLAVGPGGRSAEELLDLRRALTSLPRRQRESVVLHYYMDMPIEEIASVLGVSAGTVKSALHRGRETLGKAIGPDLAERARNRGQD